MILKKCTPFSLTFTFFLAACGGGSSPEADLIPRAGFAQEDSVIQGGDSFSLGKQNVLAFKAGGAVRSVDERDVTVSIGSTGQIVQVTVDDQTYDLVFDAGRATSFRFDNFNNDVVFEREFIANDTLETVYFAFTRFNDSRSGIEDSIAVFQPIGFLTDPLIANTQSGSATYQGRMNLVISGDQNTGFGKGDLTLEVDFDKATVSGGATIDNDFVANVPIPQTLFAPINRITIPETQISDGAISGEILIGTIDGDLTLKNGTIDGAFYGAEADGLGGVVSGELEDAAGQNIYTFQGGFSTSE